MELEDSSINGQRPINKPKNKKAVLSQGIRAMPL